MAEGTAEVHQFAYGWFNPVMAFSLAFLGSILGLGCTSRSREATTPGRRARWLLLAAVAIGGAGIWLMHFMAMLGFAVPDSPVRYDPLLTAVSMLVAVATTAVGLFLAAGWPHGWAAPAPGRRPSLPRGSIPRLVLGGLITGGGVASMHYVGMAALRIAGELTYDPALVTASVLIAVVAATTALWFALWVRRGGHTAIAALIMAAAIWAMHYTGMAAVRVELHPSGDDVPGVGSLLLIIPITLLTAGTLLATALSALQAMTEEELRAPMSAPPRPASSGEDAPAPASARTRSDG